MFPVIVGEQLMTLTLYTLSHKLPKSGSWNTAVGFLTISHEITHQSA